MNKLPLLSITLLMSIPDFCMASDAPTATLYSLTHVFDTTQKGMASSAERAFHAFSAQVPLQISWTINTKKHQTITHIRPDIISITDASGYPLKWKFSKNDFTSEAEKRITIFIETQPKGDWIDIKGSLSASVSEASSVHTAQNIKCGDSGQMNIEKLNILYKWEKGRNIEFTVKEKDRAVLKEIKFRTMSNQEAVVRSISTAHMQGSDEVILGYGLAYDEKEVSVIVSTHNEPTAVTIPLNMKVGFSGVQK